MTDLNNNIQRIKHQLALIALYESKKSQLESALQEELAAEGITNADKETLQENSDEALSILRNELIAGIEAETARSDRKESEDLGKAYEVILHDVLADDVQRKFAFSRAIMKHEQDLLAYNSEIGSAVLSFDAGSSQVLLDHLCEISLVRQLSLCMGLLPDHVEHITSNLIDRYFRVEK